MEQEAGAIPIAYSDEALEAAERGIAFQESVWERMFNDLRLEPLTLWHEDVLAYPSGAARQVGDSIGVTIDLTAAVTVPKIEKQSVGDSAEWLARYARSRGE